MAVTHFDLNINGQFWFLGLVGLSRKLRVILVFFWLVSTVSVGCYEIKLEACWGLEGLTAKSSHPEMGLPTVYLPHRPIVSMLLPCGI